MKNNNKYLSVKQKQLVSAVGMLLAGILVIVSTGSYVPKEYSQEIVTEPRLTQADVPETEAENESETQDLDLQLVETIKEIQPPPDLRSAVRLNAAFEYPEGVDTDDTDVMQSIAGQTFSALSVRDSDWMSGIYGFTNIAPADLAQQLGKGRNAVLGQYDSTDETQDSGNPDSWVVSSWTKTNIVFHDGDGKVISGYSNAKEILSMASVYAYRKGLNDQASFMRYAEALWASSHRYTVDMSEVYYCDGSFDHQSEVRDDMDVDDGTDVSDELNDVEVPLTESPPVAEGSLEETAVVETENIETDSTETDNTEADNTETTQAAEVDEIVNYITDYTLDDVPENWESIKGPERDIWEAVIAAYGDQSLQPKTAIAVEGECPGHVDLNVAVFIDGLKENKGLYAHDTIGNKKGDLDEQWTGWDNMNRLHAKCIEHQDWYSTYGLSVSTSMYIRNPLSSAEIVYYMNMLPDETSGERKSVIKQALQSVGSIPYYWGGKPSTNGFEGNGFGSLSSPDEDGRVLRGLDCSGWISWVYWSALGSRLPYESTSGFIQCGTGISRDELKAGDIIVRLGDMHHVYLFLAWSDDDHMFVIHETSGVVNNVTIDRMNVHCPYYRQLVHE